MKKTLSTLVLICIILYGCSQNKNSKSMPNNDSKTLVVYFSASGVTKGVAEKVSKEANAELIEIVPVQRYTDADLDWRDKNSRSTVEMQDKSSRPAIRKNVNEMDKYETVYIGFPIWWYTAPTIINTFIETYDLSGKNIKLFATSGGSSIDKAAKDIKATYPNLNITKSKLLNSPSENEIREFVK